jgi:hypothetical protein
VHHSGRRAFQAAAGDVSCEPVQDGVQSLGHGERIETLPAGGHQDAVVQVRRVVQGEPVRRPRPPGRQLRVEFHRGEGVAGAHRMRHP